MAQLVDRLVGRAAEVAVLDELLGDLDAGRGRALWITGGPGIGKSRLLAELAARAEAHGQLVLSGSASELERDLPFGAFVDAVDDYVESVDPHRFSRLGPDVRAELARVLPCFSEDAGGSGAPLQDERYRSHRAVRSLLEALAAKPLVLVLDDFHWADPASVELAGALLRRPPAGRVLLVFATRPQRRPSIGAEVARAEREGRLVRVELEPLTLDGARELLEDAVTPAIATALFEESGGVPFYLEQLARAPGRAGRAGAVATVAAPLLDGQVPPAVVDALRDELVQLPEGIRRVLDGAAVAGDAFEPELAAAAAGVDELIAVDALDELLREDVIRATDLPRRFRFRHPLVRRAVYELSPAGWRLGAHERTATALQDRGAAVATRAHHVERSARRGDADAIDLLRAAGDQAAARAPATAARWYAGALRLLSDDAPVLDRIELLLARADSLSAVGRLGDSHAALEEAVVLADRAAPELHARTTLACAQVERLMGHHQQATDHLLEARAAVPPASEEAVALALGLAIDGFYRISPDALRDWPVQAVEEAEDLDDPALLAAAHAVRTLMAVWTADVAAAETTYATTTALVDGLSDAQAAERLDALVSLASAELYLDRFADATRHAERALAIARSTGHGQSLPVLYAILGTTWSAAGRLAQARELLDGALEAARLRDDDQGLAWLLFNRSMVAINAGDLDAALADGRESVELATRIDQGLVTAWAGIWFGIALLSSGDPGRAVETMVGAAGEALEGIPGGWRVLCLEALTQARLELGQLDDARRTADAAQAWSEQVGLPYAAAMAHVARARVELAGGEPVRAAELAMGAIAEAERAGALLDAALARTVAGRALGEAGDREAALAQLTRAAEELDGFGAVRHRDAAEQELRRLGERVRRRSRGGRAEASGLAALTGREVEIARLAADRLTNREIAGRLYLSEKTIETHMRNVFVKLGVGSRVEVARMVEQAERTAARATAG